MHFAKPFVLALAFAVAACGAPVEPTQGQAAGPPSTGPAGPAAEATISAAPTAQAADEGVYHLVGTEPFWGGTIDGGTATYSTPENQAGAQFAVERFAGNNGISYSGMLEASRFDVMITPGTCSDGMSDRSYPYTATLVVAGETRKGCAWSDAKRFSGPENP